MEPIIHRLKIAVPSRTALKYCKKQTMRAACSKSFGKCLIWLSGYYKKIGGRKLPCGGFFYYLLYNIYLHTSSKNFSLSPLAKATLSAMVRKLFAIKRDGEPVYI
jgi:hypothetical protein